MKSFIQTFGVGVLICALPLLLTIAVTKGITSISATEKEEKLVEVPIESSFDADRLFSEKEVLGGIRIKDLNTTYTLVDNDQDREHGLSGVTNLPENKSMLFYFPKTKEYDIWMKGMYIPIDILWIGANKKVVAMHEKVQPERPNIPDAYRKIYRGAPARWILELQSGTIEKHQITVGDTVSFYEIGVEK
ncbi:MAG: DUF192 domain-containing protein [Alphaproteobacteria bacterium]|nr:DUF192 domain-containing protein [Alphaproteobacteria bacterium]